MNSLENHLLRLGIALGLVRGVIAQETLADWLDAPGARMADPAQRALVVEKARALAGERRLAARAKATRLGLPLRRVFPDGRAVEIRDFAGDRPIYFTTHNANAVISTGANLLQAAPYSVNGTALTVGVWDGGAVRSGHQEFGGRVTIKDGGSNGDHATHVAGTIAAAGVVASAKGMAPAINVDSYEWNDDMSEMTARGSAFPGEAGKIYLSNHSYGFISGWNQTGLASPKWNWWGAGTTNTGIETDFGKYDTNARDTDSLAYSLPYYLIFRSAGNERTDNPATGEPVSLNTGTSSSVAYDPAAHPPGDGVYRGNGYDTIGFDAVSKNVLTVGSVGDAVSGGVRQPANAYMSSYSSWGPTDDGRIKPDVVANGEAVYSTFSGTNTEYGTYSGTSMATPNATGSAALLISWWDKLFPGHVLRASTLKALLIHTADDRGNAGPDYQFGWGLINVKAAADLAQAYKDSPGTRRVVEDAVTTGASTRSYSFTWDGSSPIRATLCWTDPAGTATSTSDSRTARLVNNLDLKIDGPAASLHQPWVMPFVGDWSVAKLSAAATTGVNNTDNVEQVFIPAPPAAGVYTAVVTYSGTLTNGAQKFSLILSGGVASATAPAPTASSVSPGAGTTGTMILTLAGAGLLPGANVKLTKPGEADVFATGQEITGESAKFRINVDGMAPGLWAVVLTNPDGQSVTLPASFTIVSAIWQDDLESGATGWTNSATPPYTQTNWALTTTQSHSASHSFFAPGPSSSNIDDLYSPSIAVPSGAAGLQLSFWHRYSFGNGRRDGGVLEFSIDGGAWFDVTASGSGAAFASGGYNGALNSNSNPLNTRQAWTGNNTAAFTRVVVELTDSAKYAGKAVRVRWRLATNNGGPSEGWWIDDIALTGATAADLPPTITGAASATPSPVSATTTSLSVIADDDSGEPGLTYTWAVTGGTFGRPVSFSENGDNGAKTTIATFAIAGDYQFTVTVRDGSGLTASSEVDVTVGQTATSITVAPSNATVPYGGTQVFGASVLDQFFDPLLSQPAVGWSSSGGGTISAGGIFTAGEVGGPYTVTATSGALSGAASVSVTSIPPTVTTPTSASITGTTATLGGNVTGDGGMPVSARGVVFSATATNGDPFIGGAGVTTVTGSGTTGVFSVNAGSLTPGTAYSFKAYATNSDGTSYSGTGTFTTLSNNADLANLALSAGVLAPEFASGTTGYTAVVANAVTEITVTPTAADSTATITVNGTAVASGAASGPVSLAAGDNAITTVVTAQDGTTTKAYTLIITRQSAIESWRQTWYGTSSSTGAAADTADPYHTGISNLLVFAFFGPDQDPAAVSITQLPQCDMAGDRLTFSFTEPAGVSGITYGAEWSTTLLDWHPIPDTGSGNLHTFSVEKGTNPQLFVRMKVSNP